MISSWEFTKSKSTYHFNPNKIDYKEDMINYLGSVPNTWESELDKIIANSKPATWASRGYKGEGVPPPREDLKAEEYDLHKSGVDPKMIITHLNWQIPNCLSDLSEVFGLDDCMSRIHVQFPGEMWNLHIDKLQKWCPQNPSNIMRVFIQLTDWNPGQFWEFGNYHWNQWKAGDVLTFDWANIPHSTANAGHYPRVTFQLTGVRTEKTDKFLKTIHK